MIMLLSLQWINAQSLRGETVRSTTDLKIAHDISNNARIATETVLAPTAGEPCGEEVTDFVFTDGTWGTVAGMNAFGDIQKAQRLHFESSDVYNVIGVVAFVTKAVAVGDGSLYMNVYSVNEDDGGPDAYLGSTMPLLVSELAPRTDTTVNPSVFPVPDDSVMQITQPSFYVSYDFTELYFTDDTVAAGQTPNMCGAEDDTWEQFFPDDTSELVWGPVSSTWNLNFDLHVAAVVEFDDLVSADDYIASQDLKIYPASPNPARDYVQLNFEVDGRTDVTFEVFDIKGGRMYRVVREQVSLGRQAETIDISQFPAGSYYYRVATDKGEMMSRFLVGE